MPDLKAIGTAALIAGIIGAVIYISATYDLETIKAFLEQHGRQTLTILQIIALFMCGLFKKIKTGMILCCTLILTQLI